MTKFTLSLEKDGAPVATITAEVTDFAKLKEAIETIVNTLDEKPAPETQP